MNTEASSILELRRELPPHVGHLMWCSLSTSLTGVYLPFHLGIEAVEPHFARASAGYDPRSAYWLFTELAKLADYGYTRCIDAHHLDLASVRGRDPLRPAGGRGPGRRLSGKRRRAPSSPSSTGVGPRPRSRPCSGCCRR